MHSIYFTGSRKTKDPGTLTTAWTENVGHSPTRKILHTPSAKRRRVFGVSYERSAASYLEPVFHNIFQWLSASFGKACYGDKH